MNSTHYEPIRAINKCVWIHAEGVNLLGDLQIPAESTAIVIFAYGGGRCRNNPRSLHTARVIRENGIGTLLCDLLTEEEEADDQATEHFRHDAELLAKRLIAVTKWAASEPDTKDLRIAYYGACAGGAAAMIAAAGMRGSVSAVVSRSGRMDLATPYLSHVTCPTLLIVGENDTVGIELNREALPLLSGQKQMEVIPGASNLFGEPGKLEEMAHLSGDWFRSQLKQPTNTGPLSA